MIDRNVPRLHEMFLLFLSLSLSSSSFSVWVNMLNPIAVGFLASEHSATFVSTLIASASYFLGLSGIWFARAVDLFQSFKPVLLILIGLNTLSAVLLVLALQYSSLYLFSIAAIVGGSLTICIFQIGTALTASYGKASLNRTATFSAIFFVTFSLSIATCASTILVIPLTDSDSSFSYVTMAMNALSFVLIASLPKVWFVQRGLTSTAKGEDLSPSSVGCEGIVNAISNVTCILSKVFELCVFSSFSSPQSVVPTCDWPEQRVLVVALAAVLQRLPWLPHRSPCLILHARSMFALRTLAWPNATTNPAVATPVCVCLLAL